MYSFTEDEFLKYLEDAKETVANSKKDDGITDVEFEEHKMDGAVIKTVPAREIVMRDPEPPPAAKDDLTIAIQLLRDCLKDNYSTKNDNQLDPALRDRIEKFLKSKAEGK